MLDIAIRSDAFKSLICSELFESDMAGYCGSSDLDSLSRVCRGIQEPVLLMLTTRKLWAPWEVEKMPPGKRTYVRRMSVEVPESLEHLRRLGFPAGMTHLEFGCSFNQTLKKHVWPTGIKHLTFGNGAHTLY